MKNYSDSKLLVKREKDNLSMWYYYILMIKVFMTLFRDSFGTIVLTVTTIIKDEALSHNSSAKFQEIHQSNLPLTAGLKHY